MLFRYSKNIWGLARRFVFGVVSSPIEDRHYVSKSVATGLFWAFTPTVFFQQAVILVYWLVVRHSFLRFHFPLAWGVTWISNPWTILALYPLYVWLGGLFAPFLGQPDDIEVYFQLDQGILAFYNGIKPVFPQLIIGSMFMSIVSSFFGYVATFSSISLFWSRQNG